ncbi:TRAP transporter substrate-binding protein [Paenibacillaceae bacterium WGS1546]|uniref:TRAP transporter substrate-binding protein n=1 Tax=Cohnella sp. WGS1546 TaxID=3366810 RepID=UPI00372D1EF9
MSKKWMAGAAFALATVMLAGCGSNNNSGNSGQASGGDSGDGKTYTMRVGHTLTPISPRHAILEKFKETVEAETDGKLVVELYHSSSIGDNNQLLQAVPLGTIEAAVQPTSFFGGVQPKLSVLDLPFVFTDMKQIERFALSEASDELLATLEEKGMTGLALWPLGIQQLTSNKPIATPDELKGQKFRTMGTPIQLELFSNWGTSPTPIALTELYSSLQQGVIDGQSNDIGTVHDAKLYEVQKQMLLTNHGAIIDLFYVNKAWFASLPSEYQEVLKNVAKNLVTERTEEELKVIDEKRTTIIELQQMQIQVPAPDMLDWLKAQGEPVVEDFKAKNSDLVPILEAILNS